MTRGEIDRANRAAGVVLMGAAAGTVFAMMHHPSGTNGGAVGGIVHGGLILLLGLMTWGFLIFALALGGRRPWVLAGIIAYAISLFGHIGAATINGFVVPALAGRDTMIDHDIFLLAWEANQALARLGVVATGIAYASWSVELLRTGRSVRWLGIAGVLTGLIPASLLVAGLIRMNLSGAIMVYGVHALWAALVGTMLWQGKVFAADQAGGYSATTS